MFKNIIDKFKYERVNANIDEKIRKIRLSNKKIRVLFYVCEKKYCYERNKG